MTGSLSPEKGEPRSHKELKPLFFMPWCLRGLQKTNSDYEGRHEDLKTFVLKPLCLSVFVFNPNSTGITRCLVLRQDGRRSVRLGLEKGQRAGFRNGRGPNARGAGIGRKVIRMGIGDLKLGGGHFAQGAAQSVPNTEMSYEKLSPARPRAV